MEYGYRNAVKTFLSAESDVKLFVDLDAPKNKMNAWFSRLESNDKQTPLVFSEEKKESVYFMIQEMEAWFLKQPACFEKWARIKGWTRRTSAGEEEISSHSLISGKDIESVSKPSEVTKTLLKHFFEKRTGKGKRKLATYGKLTTAPLLLDNLDVQH